MLQNPKKKPKLNNMRPFFLFCFLIVISIRNSSGQFIAKSAMTKLELNINDRNSFLNLSDFLTEDVKEGFVKLLKDSCFKSSIKKNVSCFNNSYSIVEIELCQKKGNIYSNRIYLIKKDNGCYYYFINCDTLFFPKNRNNEFVLFLNIKGKLIAQQFTISASDKLFQNKEICLFKNDDCSVYDSSLPLERTLTKTSRIRVYFNVHNECDSSTHKISRIMK